jgi:hypothetical protein
MGLSGSGRTSLKLSAVLLPVYSEQVTPLGGLERHRHPRNAADLERDTERLGNVEVDAR